ncbi:MAG: LysR family transcriptional regulator [Gammaproteobacteria bacterium]|nr:LysR family transcriptional regulator [Gammaproteobacteria bacterium]
MSKFLEYQNYVQVYEQKSITKAAKQLNISTSSVSKRLVKLESAIKVQLVDRTTHNLSITPLGEKFYLRCKAILDQVKTSELLIQEENEKIDGRIRISVPEILANRTFLLGLKGFFSEFPEVNLEINVTNDITNMIDSEIDFCFRVGSLVDSQLIAIPILTLDFIFCASPNYLRNNEIPDHYQDLIRDNKLILPTYINVAKESKEFFPNDNIIIKSTEKFHSSDHFNTIYNLALSGFGVTLLPTVYIKQALSSDQLVQIYPNYQSPEFNVSLVYNRKLTMTKLMTEFKDHIKSTY